MCCSPVAIEPHDPVDPFRNPKRRAGEMISRAADHPALPVWQPIDAAAFRLQFARLMRARAIHALALGVALSTSDAVKYSVANDIAMSTAPFGALLTYVDRTVTIVAAVAMLSALQAGIARADIRRPTMAVAIAVLSIAMPALMASLHLYWEGALITPRELSLITPWELFLYLVGEALAACVLFAVLYEWEWSADQVLNAVRNARIADEVAERATLESRLNAMQARIDPRLLFAVLERAQALYAQQASAAERLIERLIDFLRATLPVKGATAVTLAQELDLCASYLDLRQGLRDGALVYDISNTAGGQRYFPPSVVLPLLESLIPESGTVPVTVAIAVRESHSSLCIDLSCTPAAPAEAHKALMMADDILRRFFGDRASIDVRSDSGRGTTVCLEIRHAAS